MALKILPRISALVLIAAMAAALTHPVLAGSSGGRVKVIAQELSALKRSWTYKKIKDPTGTAPVSKVERFEIRDGDCKGGDCKPKIIGDQIMTRARVEKHMVTDLKEGETAWYIYHLYIPSAEHNFVPHMSTTYGQLYLLAGRKSFDGGPLWSLDTEAGGRKMIVTVFDPYPVAGGLETEKARIFKVGELGGSLPLDSWIKVAVRIKLSQGKDGFIETYVNDRKVGTYTGPNMMPGSYLEYDYGMYQIGTNLWGNRNGGSVKGLPPQVAYYANPGMVRE